MYMYIHVYVIHVFTCVTCVTCVYMCLQACPLKFLRNYKHRLSSLLSHYILPAH